MTTDLEQRLRVVFREDAERARLVNPEGPVDADERPPAPQQGIRTARWLVAAAVLIVAGVVGVVLIQDGDEGDRQVTTTPGPTEVNGPIVTGDGFGWPEGASAPQRPDARPGYSNDGWQDVDPETGSFLYVSYTSGRRIWILDEDGGEEADFTCDSVGCISPVFGPGSDEVTMVAPENGRQLQVMAWDGTVRDTLDISRAFTRESNGMFEQFIGVLAWSPDRSRVAVGLISGYDCEPSLDPCAIQIWVFDRNGGEPQLVHTARDQSVEAEDRSQSVIGDLSWSPDGNSLGVVVAPRGRPTRPSLVVLRLRSGEAVRSDVLHGYGDAQSTYSHATQYDYGDEFPFAWSPDGTRIAVASGDGVAEISSEDGSILARHPGPDPDGHVHDVAWLPGD